MRTGLRPPTDTHDNRLLAALPVAVAARLLPRLERVSTGLREVLYEAGGPIPHVYFPLTATFSLLLPLADRSAAEVMTVGNEGLVGLPEAVS